MMSDEDGPPEGDDLVELCTDADVSVEHLLSLYELVHHHQHIVNLEHAMKELELPEDATKRLFRIACLQFECHTTGAALYHLPDFAYDVAVTLNVDPYHVAAFWNDGMGDLREALLSLFDGRYRGKELKFQLEENQRHWASRIDSKLWTVFMTLVVAETHFEESVSPARFTIKKIRTPEEGASAA